MCDAAGGGVPAAALQGSQLPGQEQRVRQQQILYLPQVSVNRNYTRNESGSAFNCSLFIPLFKEKKNCPLGPLRYYFETPSKLQDVDYYITVNYPSD